MYKLPERGGGGGGNLGNARKKTFFFYRRCSLSTTNHDCLFNIEILLISALLPERDIRINFDYNSHLYKKRMQKNIRIEMKWMFKKAMTPLPSCGDLFRTSTHATIKHAYVALDLEVMQTFWRGEKHCYILNWVDE